MCEDDFYFRVSAPFSVRREWVLYLLLSAQFLSLMRAIFHRPECIFLRRLLICISETDCARERRTETPLGTARSNGCSAFRIISPELITRRGISLFLGPLYLFIIHVYFVIGMNIFCINYICQREGNFRQIIAHCACYGAREECGVYNILWYFNLMAKKSAGGVGWALGHLWDHI